MAQGQETGPDPRRVTRRYRVGGRVQGVGFRYFVLRQAQVAGVTGWVRNLPSGEVEVTASGSPEHLATLEQALRRGPRFSDVTKVEISEIPDEGDDATDFEIVD